MEDEMRKIAVILIIMSIFLLGCRPIIHGANGSGVSPNYPSFTPLGNPQGSQEHREAQSNYKVGGFALDATSDFDPIYDTFCTFDDYFVTWVCPKYAVEQNPNIVHELNALFRYYIESLK
jgi:hypothetical protein